VLLAAEAKLVHCRHSRTVRSNVHPGAFLYLVRQRGENTIQLGDDTARVAFDRGSCGRGGVPAQLTFRAIARTTPAGPDLYAVNGSHFGGPFYAANKGKTSVSVLRNQDGGKPRQEACLPNSADVVFGKDSC
jgi:hypothetical protein